jgi:hypothetical protein
MTQFPIFRAHRPPKSRIESGGRPRTHLDSTMTTWNPQANDVFLKLLELPPGDERQCFLQEACANDAALRVEVEALLDANAQAGNFLEAPPAFVNLEPAHDKLLTERPGALIGRYKLLEQIGEGGFGVVFMAEQQEPVRRKVALKIIKLGMDTRQVIARFEAERQALALMDHRNIAKVLDAGATDSGRPFFVMELIKGLPITEYCDQSKLTVRERLDLFIAVCQAVQHAHQKGIIHRDIKPTNVLVTLHDGAPVVKVIDFGIAKATGQQLTEKTLFTNFAQMIGTPLYMSPEQAALSDVDVDTRIMRSRTTNLATPCASNKNSLTRSRHTKRRLTWDPALPSADPIQEQGSGRTAICPRQADRRQPSYDRGNCKSITPRPKRVSSPLPAAVPRHLPPTTSASIASPQA